MGCSKTHMAAIKAALAEASINDGQFAYGTQVVLDKLAARTGLDRGQALRCLRKLENSGWLKLVRDERVPARELGQTYGPARRNPVWAVVRDIRARRDNQVTSRITCRDKIWATLRAVRRATQSDLVRLTECTESSVAEYIRVLRHGGYVKAAGLRSRETLWILAKDAGPRRPETPDVAPKRERWRQKQQEARNAT